jgi:3-oxoacyl-[acyl-carrier protein] reductase
VSQRYPELEDRVVIVTGGARGIGEACVRDLAGHGARVVLNYNRSEERALALAEELGGSRVLPVHADLALLDDVESLWQRALGWRGRVDVLVNNASLRSPVGFDEATPETWDANWIEVLRINLVSAAHLSRFAVQHIRERGGGGIIIGITGRIAVRGDMPDYFADGASKGGMNSLLRGIARFFARDGVLTYLICGGLIDTDQYRMQVELYGGEEQFLAEVPLGEPGRPQDISELVLFLASGRARYSTGATIDAVGASFLH